MKRGILLVRADATVTSGTGHVMRCLALAQAWQRAGGKVVFAMERSTPAVLERLQGEDIQVVHLHADDNLCADAAKVISLAREKAASWVVVDGYQFDSAHQEALTSNGLKVLVVDDLGRAMHYSADLVLNQNAHAEEVFYRDRGERTRLLLGPRYAMLRPQFASWGDWQRAIPAAGRRVLITMGGSDPDNFTLGVVEALQLVELGDLEVLVVAGGSNPHLPVLEAAVGRARHPSRLVTNADNMPELMVWADVAISAAGTTCWEMCCLGLPSLTVDLAPNQLPVAQRLDQLGVTRHIGSSRDCPAEKVARDLMWLLKAEEVRRQMSCRGRELVDGQGSERTRAALLDRELTLRPVRESDCRILFEWAQDSTARAASFHSAAISWEDHNRWFAERLHDPQSVIYIGENVCGVPVGLVRFQLKDGSAVLSVNVAPAFRGAGWGRELILFSTHDLRRARPVARIDAFVRPENQASVRLFEASGFRFAGKERVGGQDALLFSWESGVGTHVS